MAHDRWIALPVSRRVRASGIETTRASRPLPARLIVPRRRRGAGALPSPSEGHMYGNDISTRRRRRTAAALGGLGALAALAALAVLACTDAVGVPDLDRGGKYEVWLVDQSDTPGRTHGG